MMADDAWELVFKCLICKNLFFLRKMTNLLRPFPSPLLFLLRNNSSWGRLGIFKCLRWEWWLICHRDGEGYSVTPAWSPSETCGNSSLMPFPQGWSWENTIFWNRRSDICTLVVYTLDSSGDVGSELTGTQSYNDHSYWLMLVYK